MTGAIRFSFAQGSRAFAQASRVLVGFLATAGCVEAQQAPHPAVARIVVPEAGGVAYGSGTLVDVRDQYGLVATNWHVVRDAIGKIEVRFPNGFRSEARALKLDEDWDLAALVIWRPPIEPAPIATHAPRPGEPLTICGYGQGQYRAATGRCTEYYAPKAGWPHELVELSVEARQGDSGGPIFNQRGEIAGVLFGAADGTTLGAFGGRVNAFLSTLASDIGPRPASTHAIAQHTPQVPPATLTAVRPLAETAEEPVSAPPVVERQIVEPPVVEPSTAEPPMIGQSFAAVEPDTTWQANTTPLVGSDAAEPFEGAIASSLIVSSATWFDDVKSAFALVGVFAVLMVVVKTIV